jgi:hypothetical protein
MCYAQLIVCCFLLAGTLQEPLYNGPPAKEYPFELDSFQKTSVACLVSTVGAVRSQTLFCT